MSPASGRSRRPPGHALLAQLEHGDLEVGGPSGELRLLVIVGEGHGKGLRVASRRPTRLSSKPGMKRSRPMISGIRSVCAPSIGAPSLRAVEADHGVVVGGGAAILDRHQRGLLVAQLLDDLVDRGVVDHVDRDPEWVVGVGAELHLRPQGQSHPVARAGVLAEAEPLRVRDGQQVEVLVAHRLEHGVLEEVLLGVVVDGFSASGSSRRTPSARSSSGRGTLPGRKPGTLVRRARWRTDSSTWRRTWSAGNSTSRTTELRSAGRVVTFICPVSALIIGSNEYRGVGGFLRFVAWFALLAAAFVLVGLPLLLGPFLTQMVRNTGVSRTRLT